MTLSAYQSLIPHKTLLTLTRFVKNNRYSTKVIHRPKDFVMEPYETWLAGMRVN